MNSKINAILVVLVISATVFQVSESILFTASGLWLDSNIALILFSKFMYVIQTLSLGKRDVSPTNPINWSELASPEQYLSVAASVDTNRCIPLAVCVAMAKSRDPNSKRNQFENLVIDTFGKKMTEPSSNTADRVSPLSYYVEAAKFGQTVGVADNCRLVAPTCKYTLDELSQLTQASLN